MNKCYVYGTYLDGGDDAYIRNETNLYFSVSAFAQVVCIVRENNPVLEPFLLLLLKKAQGMAIFKKIDQK